MATKPGEPLTAQELELVAGLDTAFQPFALRHRGRVLTRNIPFTFTDGRRSFKQQATLYAEREGKPNQVAVPAGTSKHELGFAYDFSGPRTEQERKIAAAEAVALGLESGINYRPNPEPWHVEAPTARATLATIQAMRIAALAVTLGIAGVIVYQRVKG